MLDSLLSWKKGMTRQASFYIRENIASAAKNIFLVLSQLEDWLSKLGEEGEIAQSLRT
jgi:hypothetical protein